MAENQLYPITIRAKKNSFLSDRKGLAAVEFALIMPMLFGAFIWASIVGTALLDKQDLAKKVRLGVEGILRFDGDIALAKSFADSTGQAAFQSESQSSFNNSTVSITTQYRCRTTTTVTVFTTKSGATCVNPEAWYTVSASDTSLSPFGQQSTIVESVTFLGN